ncbi:hypothetical protein BC829DRAFT_230519 [Chytridium lagenaria]|nr:hypothetical protein BC829DRAFT_230519 [Chytridium lagenaria]
MRNTKSTDFTFLIESAISRLSLAWIASALPLDLSSNLRFIVYQNLEIADRTPVDAVAIDLVLLCTLLVASVVVLILYVGVCVVSLLGSWDEGYEARKARWDALEKLAGTYCTKGEMTPRLSVKSEESPMSLRKAYRNKGIKVNTGVKVVEASVETPTSATSEMGTPVVGVHRSGSRSRLVKAVSVRRSATLEKEEVMVSKGKEEVAGKGDGEIKRPLWEVLFTREGWERVMEMLGERPRHKAPRKVYTVCTMSNALKKAA